MTIVSCQRNFIASPCRLRLIDSARHGAESLLGCASNSGPCLVEWPREAPGGAAITERGTVHVLDDDPLVRRSLERLFLAAGYAVSSYATGADFMAVVQPVGCLLLDLRLPDMDGLELLQRLAAGAAVLPVIVLTGVGDVASAVQAMKAGAVDFIEKPYDDEMLLAAIGAALRAATREEHAGAAAATRLARLSTRERQVLDRLALGRPHKVIGADLGISARTVEVHRRRMLDRLGVGTAAEAIRLWALGSPPS